MRLAALALAATLGIAASANATPSPPNLTAQQNATVVQAAWGCGWGFHPNPWGRCVPNG